MFSQNDNDDILVKGDDGTSEGKRIGVVGDSLKVYATQSSVPAGYIQWQSSSLLNGTAENMAVNGSATAQVYAHAISSGETWYISSLRLCITDGVGWGPTKFGDITGSLTNGVLIEYSSGGINYQILNIKNNTNMLGFEVKLIPDIMGVGTTAVLIYTFQPNITLVAGDYVRVSIRDNLTALTYMNSSIRKWRPL